MQYYSAIKKNEFVFPFETICMNQEGIMLNKMSDRERQIVYAFTYRWNLKLKQINKYNKNILTDQKKKKKNNWWLTERTGLGEEQNINR